MNEQRLNQQNFEKHSPVEIPFSERVYAFRDLPKEVRENLLRLQKSDGDILKTSEKGIFMAKIIALLLILNIFGAFVTSFDFSSLDAAKAFGFSVGFILLALWTTYFGRNVYLIFKSPIRNHAYLTATQLIETKNGTVRYSELKDVVEIVLDKVANKTSSGGSDYILRLVIIGSNCCEYPFERWWTEPLAEADKWREKATVWRDEAVSAVKRGDKAYFDSRDIIQKSLIANVPIFKASFRFFTPRFLFKVSLFLIAVFLVFKVISNFL